MVGAKPLIVCVFAVLAWLLLGTIVYKIAGNCSSEPTCVASVAVNDTEGNGTFCTTSTLVQVEDCGWSAAESFYYAVQAGLSIGFGVLPETAEMSRFYTIFHILAGSSLIGGCLALFIMISVEKHTNQRDLLEKHLAEYAQRVHTDGYAGFTVKELVPLMVKYVRFYRDILELVDNDEDEVSVKVDAYKKMTEEHRFHVAEDLLSVAHSQVPSLRDGKLSIDELKEIHRDQAAGTLRKLKVFVKQNATVTVVWGALIIWLLVGTLFAMLVEGWSPIQAVYFAVSTCSTGGLQGVSRKDFNLIFVAIYALVGVPMYGAALGVFANVLSDRYNKKVFDVQVDSRFEVEELEFVEHINGATSESDTIDFGEYMEIQLLRLGKVDRGLLRQLRDQFQCLDDRGNGRVPKDALLEKDKRRIARVSARVDKVRDDTPKPPGPSGPGPSVVLQVEAGDHSTPLATQGAQTGGGLVEIGPGMTAPQTGRWPCCSP